MHRPFPGTTHAGEMLGIDQDQAQPTIISASSRTDLQARCCWLQQGAWPRQAVLYACGHARDIRNWRVRIDALELSYGLAQHLLALDEIESSCAVDRGRLNRRSGFCCAPIVVGRVNVGEFPEDFTNRRREVGSSKGIGDIRGQKTDF